MPNNLKSASRKAQQEAQLDMLDSLGQDQAGFDLVNTNENPFEDAIAAFITRVKENIQNEDMVKTGGIEDIRIRIQDNKVQITGNPWLLYQNYGVNGSVNKLYPNSPFSYKDKMPPPDVFVDYIKSTNMMLRNSENLNGKLSPYEDIANDDKAIKSTAFAMAKNIFKNGFKPRNIYSKEIPQLVDDLKKQAGNFAIQQVKQLFNVKDSAKRIIIQK